jgi:hypothetical protein
MDENFELIPRSDGAKGFYIYITKTEKGTVTNGVTVNTAEDYVKVAESYIQPKPNLNVVNKAFGNVSGLEFDNVGQGNYRIFVFAQGNNIYEIAILKDYMTKYKSQIENIIKSIDFDIDESASWKTYNASSFSFKYPINYRVEEREKNYFVVVEDKATVAPTEGISVDARLSGAFSNYNNALNVIKENLGNINEQTVSGGIKITGVIYSGFGEGIPTLHYVLKRGNGAVVISLTQKNPDEQLFDTFFSTFKFTN